MNYMQKQAAVKLAQTRLAINWVIRNRLMQKEARTVGTIARSIPGSMVGSALLGGVPLVNDAALIAGSVADDKSTIKDMAKGEREGWGYDFIPGVGPYRLAAKRRALENEFKKDKSKANRTLSEVLGSGTSILGATGLGALAGGLLGGGPGALAGAGLGIAGSGLATLGGALGTNFTRGRDKADLEKYYNEGSALSNYLIPGVASYNSWKNLMAADRLMDEEDAKEEKKKK